MGQLMDEKIAFWRSFLKEEAARSREAEKKCRAEGSERVGWYYRGRADMLEILLDVGYVRCPGCGEEYLQQIGPTCSCMEDAQDIMAEKRVAMGDQG